MTSRRTQRVTSLFRRDLERMRQPAGVLSSEEIARLRHEAEAELEGQRAVAQARKQKMLKVGYPSWQPSGMCSIHMECKLC